MELLPDNPEHIKPTAQIPLLEGWRLEFVKALKKDYSPLELIYLFPQLALEMSTLQPVPKLNLERTVVEMGHHMTKKKELFDLFHSIPRRVLESVVLGTVAYDKAKGDNKLVGLSEDGGGVYVMGLCVADSNGEFMNAQEMVTFVDNLQKYIDAYDAYKVHGGNPVTTRDKDLSTFVDEVDSTWGKGLGGGQPKFINTDSKRAAVVELGKWFTTRSDSMRQIDPSGETRSVQSPLYVGCSCNIKTRIQSYELKQGTSSLEQANELYGLTVSLMGYQHVWPVPQIVTAVRMWEPTHLVYGEILVSAIAGSYVSQGGLNIEEGGGNTDKQTFGQLMHARDYVFASEPYLEENVDRTEAYVKKLARAKELLKQFEDIDLVEQKKKLAEEEWKDIVKRVERAKERDKLVTEARRRLAEQRKELDRQIEMGESLLRILEAIVEHANKSKEAAVKDVGEQGDVDAADGPE